MKFAVRIIYQPKASGPAQTRLRLFGFGPNAGSVTPMTTVDAIGLALDELEREGELALLAPLAVVAHGGLAAEAWANDAARAAAPPEPAEETLPCAA